MNTIHTSTTNNQNNSSAAAPPASSLAHPPAYSSFYSDITDEDRLKEFSLRTVLKVSIKYK